MGDETGRLEQLLETYAPEGAGAAHLEATRQAERQRHATALLTNVAHVAAEDDIDEDPDPDLA